MSLVVRHASTMEVDPRLAVRNVARELAADDADVVVFFCSASYPLDALGAEIDAAFRCPVLGCTSSGQIGDRGYDNQRLSAMAFAGGALRCEPFTISPLTNCHDEAARIGELVRARRESSPASRRFGLLLVDGLALQEEHLSAALYEAIDDVPIVGGSAADDLRFEGTFVYSAGRFLQNAAVLAIFETDLPFVPLLVHHYRPTALHLVITEADAERRVIRELNGEPATRAYADAIGVEVSALGPEVFCMHPLMLRMGDEYYVRSIARSLPDGSFELYCAVEVGLVVTLGTPVDPRERLAATLASVRDQLDQPLILAFDCVLRRVEFAVTQRTDEISALLAEFGVFGCSTYGEQFNGLHMNQTLTGIAIACR